MLDLTLYLVTDSTGLEEPVFLERIEQACRGGITLLQLREKEKSGQEYFELARKVKSISDRYQIPLIIDDRADIAAAADAAGVHVGQSDLPVFAARALLGPGKIVGGRPGGSGLPWRRRDLPDHHKGKNGFDPGFHPERDLPQRFHSRGGNRRPERRELRYSAGRSGRGHLRRFRCNESGRPLPGGGRAESEGNGAFVCPKLTSIFSYLSISVQNIHSVIKQARFPKGKRACFFNS